MDAEIHSTRYLNLTSDTSAKTKRHIGITTDNDENGNAPPGIVRRERSGFIAEQHLRITCDG